MAVREVKAGGLVSDLALRTSYIRYLDNCTSNAGALIFS
jgi:hypothetical protein